MRSRIVLATFVLVLLGLALSQSGAVAQAPDPTPADDLKECFDICFFDANCTGETGLARVFCAVKCGFTCLPRG